MKISLSNQTCISRELDDRHIGNDNYRGELILRKMQDNNERFLEKLKGVGIHIDKRGPSTQSYFCVDGGGCTLDEVRCENEDSGAETVFKYEVLGEICLKGDCSANRSELLCSDWTVQKVVDLYHGVQQFFCSSM